MAGWSVTKMLRYGVCPCGLMRGDEETIVVIYSGKHVVLFMLSGSFVAGTGFSWCTAILSEGVLLL